MLCCLFKGLTPSHLISVISSITTAQAFIFLVECPLGSVPGFLRVTFRSSLTPRKARSEGEPARKCRRRAASCGICFLAELEAWLPGCPGEHFRGRPGFPAACEAFVSFGSLPPNVMG